MTKEKTKKFKIIAVLMFLMLFSALIIFLFSGKNFEILKEIFNTNASKDDIRHSISKLGARSYIVVALLSMIQVVFTFVPAEPLHVISGISFGLVKGMIVCLIGILIGNTIVYVLNKIFGDKLKDYFSSNINFDFNSAKTSNKIALLVIILYCLPAIPYGIICFFAASMNIKYPKYILITGIGSIPSLLLDVGLGHVTMATSWIVSIVVFAVIVVLLILMWKFKTQIFNKVNEYIKRSKEKQKNKVGNFNPLIYGLVGSVVYGLVKSKVKIKLKNNVKKLQKPCIVLCNHGSFYDFAYAGKLLRKDKPHFVVARMYFHNKKLAYVINGTGAFAKSMFVNDIESLKNCMKVISGKGVLAMMPEARLSTVGKFEDIQESTYSFIKKVKVPVYVVKINGAYLAKPKWANKIRKGAYVEAELNQLFTAEELESLDVENIKQKVEEALNYNEWEWLALHPEIKYKNNDIAVGLENILNICPRCNKLYTLATDKNIIKCEHCGLEVNVDNRYQLYGVEFDNIAKWYDWQVEQVKKQIENEPEFCLESKVELRHLSKDGKSCTRHAGEGVCVLNRQGLYYKGTQDDKQIEKMFPIDSIYRLLFGAGEDFEIYEGNELYYFVPENKKSAVMWYIVSGLLKN